MRDETIGDFLDRLADRVPAPGGGASAALQTAQGAALLAMVARFSTGEEYAEHRATIERIITEADELRAIALRLGEADAEAFPAWPVPTGCRRPPTPSGKNAPRPSPRPWRTRRSRRPN